MDAAPDLIPQIKPSSEHEAMLAHTGKYQGIDFFPQHAGFV